MTKNIKIDKHFINENLSNGQVCIPFVNSKRQLADVLTKGLSFKAFHNYDCKMGMTNIYAPSEGKCWLM